MKRIAAIALPILAVALYLSFARVPEGSVGIIDHRGRVDLLKSGIHFHAPFSPAIIIYPTDLAASGKTTAITLADGSSYSVGFDLAGRLDAEKAPAFHAAAHGTGADSLLAAAGDSALRESAATAKPTDLASGSLETSAAARAARSLASLGLTDVSLKLKPLAAPECLKLAQALAGARLAGTLRDAAARLVASADAGWEAHTTMGIVLESERDVHAAEKEYLDALTLSPGAIPPMAQLVAIYSAVGEFARLDRLLDAAIQSQPTSVQHLGWSAMSLLRQKKLPEAELALERALAVEPSNLLLLNNLGGVEAQAGRMADATATFRKAVTAKSDDRQSLYNLGVALCADGHDAQGLPYLLQAEKAGEPHAALLDAIAHAYRKTGDAKRAKEYAARASATRTRVSGRE